VPIQSVDVLLVDDDAAVAETTSDVLELSGFTCSVVSSLDEAARLLREGAVGVIILDHSLVQSSWLTVQGTTPVILMSGMGRDEIDQIRREHGERYHAFLAKPVPPDRLVKIVGEALGL
jgi:DNA-binding NtrC family response regulator